MSDGPQQLPDDDGFFGNMKRHPIFAGCLLMMGAMLALFGGCIMGIVTNPFVK